MTTVHDLYLKTTNASGCSFHSSHRVWDSNRFMAARQRDADKENAKAQQEDPKAPTLAKAEQLTLTQFNSRA